MQEVEEHPAYSITKFIYNMATKNNFTTLVSVRLDNEVVESLEKVIKSDGYHSRSSVINFLLMGILTHTDQSDILFMINKGSWSHCKWNIKIERS